MIKTPTSLPGIRHNETDTDKFFAYLASHTTRSTNTQPIATISHDQSARQTWTTPQITILCILATMTIIALWTFGIAILTAIFAAVTVLYVALLCLGTAWMIAVARAIPSTPFNDEIIHDLADAPWPSYTILCPLYREKAVVPQFVNAMKALDYPSDCLQVLFLTEEDDQETREAILALNLPAHFQVVTVPQGTPKTKPRACNYGLQQATGDYVVIFDAEDIPDPLQLKKAILTFASNDVNVACVQAMLNFYNPVQNPLTRFFTIEYSLWFDIILPGLQRLGFSLPLGGTSNHFRISALKALGGWDAFNVTEDCDLGLKLAKYGFRTIVLNSTTYEEANSRTFSWVKQRSRWIKGYMQTYLVHTRHPLSALKKGKIKDLLSLHLFVGAGSIVLLINPIMWAMFAAYLIWQPVDLYHHLFPWPVLYAGMLCFLVGNFLPIYVSMIACVKREQYTLVKWCLLLPLYWALASVAAFLAGYELIVKPHHWHKTQHGLHLKDKKSTAKVAAIQKAGKVAVSDVSSQAVGNITQSVRAMSTVLVPAVSKSKTRSVKARDPWLVATIVLACMCSIAATTYFSAHYETLLYADAYSHLRIARSLIDSATPGLTQLGGVWLPLHHIAMEPLIWNDYLWKTGLAGIIPSMLYYVFSVYALYSIINLLSHQRSASFLGTLAYIINPNILYLQSTPLSEVMCNAAFFGSCLFFLRWTRTSKTRDLIATALGVFFFTLIRYDGWALFIALSAGVIIVGWLKREQVRRIEGQLVVYCVLAISGILLWLIWCKVIFGNPLYFQNSQFSAGAQQSVLQSEGRLYTYHNLWQSLRYYGLDSFESFGVLLSVVACIGIFFFIIRSFRSTDLWTGLVLLVPFAFYVVTLYGGQSVLYLPSALPAHVDTQWFNTRYGTQMIGPLACFIGILPTLIYRHKQRVPWHLLLQVSLSVLIICQTLVTMYLGIITLNDGLENRSCMDVSRPFVVYLAQHYDNGKILADEYAVQLNPQVFNAHFSNFIYEGSGALWKNAIAHPETSVEWIVIEKPNGNIASDILNRAIDRTSPVFKNNFTLVDQDKSGVLLYHHNGIAIIPPRPIPADIIANEHLCAPYKKAGW